ncbi:MAG: gamma carbonic anhydrase family protein [Eubacteriales bacterium]|nr:gamma carbonic anhydrase family protein [Eubacteriales bacterium]
MIRSYQGKTPIVDPTSFVADTAVLIGDVVIGAESSVWYNSVLRGDDAPIVIGDQSNIQDLCMLHDHVLIGHRVTVGHHVTLHGCTIEDDALIGMGSTILDGAVVGRGALVAAGSLVLANTQIEAGAMYAGSPAVFKKHLNQARLAANQTSVEHYLNHLKHVHLIDQAKDRPHDD